MRDFSKLISLKYENLIYFRDIFLGDLKSYLLQWDGLSNRWRKHSLYIYLCERCILYRESRGLLTLLEWLKHWVDITKIYVFMCEGYTNIVEKY